MQLIKGKQYIVGTVNISAAALARLAELGVTPPKDRNRYWMYGSFFLPEGEDGKEFFHKRGDPLTPGRLTLAVEPVAQYYGATYTIENDELEVTSVFPVDADWDGYKFHGYCRPTPAEIKRAGYEVE